MTLDSTAIQSLAYLTEGGAYRQPADSGLGGLYRPFATNQPGAPVATLETLYDFFVNNVYNPNEALLKDPQFRAKIRMHPDVAPALEKREITVASFPDRIEANPLSKNPHEAKIVAEYVENVWRQIPNLRKLYQQMQLAVSRGGIGIEFTWMPDSTNFGTNTWGSSIQRPYRWHSVDQSRFMFDRLGNMSLLTRTQPVWGAYVNANPNNWLKNPIPGKNFPLGKFIYHTHKFEPGTWVDTGLEGYQYFGLGLDVPLYYVVTFDIFCLRLRMKMLEKFGLPPVDIYYPDNTPPGQLRRIADSVRQESVCTIPHPVGVDIDKMWKIVSRDFPKMSYDAFDNMSQWTASHVAKIVFGDAGESQKEEGGKGSFTDHVSRRASGAEVYFLWDCQNISATINDQLIPSIVYQRFPNLPWSDMPVHRLEPKEERDRSQEMDIIEKATKIISIAKAEAYERLGFRIPKAGEPVIEVQQDQPQMPGQPGGPGGPIPPAPGMPVKPKAGIGQNGANGAVAHTGRMGSAA